MFKKFLFPVLCAMIIMSCTKPCDDTICMNDGVCVDGTCLCPEGFYGEYCENTDEDHSYDDYSNNSPCNSDVITYNNRVYSLVEVNGTCWFAENLKSESFNNGDPITMSVQFNQHWSSIGNSNGDSYLVPGCWGTEYESTAGYLYNGFTIIDDRNVCPVGWHVATDVDWKNVELLIGVSQDEVDSKGNSRAEGFGHKLVSENHYGEDVLGLNLTPTGYVGSCEIVGSQFDNFSPFIIDYWTSTYEENTNNEYLYKRSFQNDPNSWNFIGRSTWELNNGSAVRCVKD